ncbi:MAG TPA: CoA ester lyase [Steroidobacteraceae bacterium]|jgi:Citrate lyase beta subunit|nr:CoA ester lyase [Steroidobacteraceae bacterium]
MRSLHSRALRLQRSVLAVPATSERFVASAARSAADAIFLDLEDAVVASRKVEARALAIRALTQLDWGDRIVSVRINDISSAWGYRDIIEVAAQCPRLDTVLVPKVSDSEQIRFVERLLASVEADVGREAPIGIEAIVETPQGVANVEHIASASARLESLAFGTGDYSLAMHVPQTRYGSPDPDYGVLGSRSDGTASAFHWNDQWHFALARIANACRANALRPLDGPFTAIDEPAGYEASARKARALGFEGKWAIHPSQIESANRIFIPTPAELTWALRVRDAMSSAAEAGQGATKLDGAMIDLAHVKHAEVIRSRQRLVDARCPRGRKLERV